MAKVSKNSNCSSGFSKKGKISGPHLPYNKGISIFKRGTAFICAFGSYYKNLLLQHFFVLKDQR
jgi:hypothetical protein